MKKFQNGLFFFNAAVVSVERWIGGVEKFIEREGIEVQQVDHAHWIGFWLGEQRAEQAAGGDDVVVVGFFFEIFEGVECFRTFLNFVEDDERFFRQNFLIGNHRQQLNNTMGIFAGIKDGAQVVCFVEVEISCIVIIGFAKFFHQPGFSHLTRAFENQRFSVSA